MAAPLYYFAAAAWDSPKVIGRDVTMLRLFSGRTTDELGVENTVKARVLTEDRRAQDIIVVYLTGDKLLRRIRDMLTDGDG